MVGLDSSTYELQLCLLNFHEDLKMEKKNLPCISINSLFC